MRVANGATHRAKRDLARKLVEIAAEHEAKIVAVSTQRDAEVAVALQGQASAVHQLGHLQREHALATAQVSQLQAESSAREIEHEKTAANLRERLVSAERTNVELNVCGFSPVVSVAVILICVMCAHRMR